MINYIYNQLLSMNIETLYSFIPTTISLVVTSLFGLLVGVLVEKFKNRLRVIKYNVYTQDVKPNLSRNLSGDLKITLNNRVIDSLRIAHVELENKNNIDLVNIKVKFLLNNRGIFQGTEGSLSNSLSWLNWSKNHNDTFQAVLSEYNSLSENEGGEKEVSDDLQNRIDYVNSNQEYLIPVFNRKETAHFTFLFEDALNGVTSDLHVSILHESVKLEMKLDDEKEAAQRLKISVLIGIVITATVITLLCYNYPRQKSLIIIVGIIGFSNTLIGMLILWVYRQITAFFK